MYNHIVRKKIQKKKPCDFQSKKYLKLVNGKNSLYLDLKCSHNTLSETIHYAFADFSSKAFKCVGTCSAAKFSSSQFRDFTF